MRRERAAERAARPGLTRGRQRQAEERHEHRQAKPAGPIDGGAGALVQALQGRRQEGRGQGRFYPFRRCSTTTVMSLVVVSVNSSGSRLSEVDVVRAAPRRTECRASWAPSTPRPPDPGTTSFVPRPGLVLLLPLLSPADLQVAETRLSSATVIIRTFCFRCCWPRACRSSTRGPGAAPHAAPGRRRRWRSSRSSRWGVLTWKGATAQGGGSAVRGDPRRAEAWIKDNNLPAAAVPGAKLFAGLRLYRVSHLTAGKAGFPRNPRPRRDPDGRVGDAEGSGSSFPDRTHLQVGPSLAVETRGLSDAEVRVFWGEKTPATSWRSSSKPSKGPK